ncbi:MAG TPA: hypothetical protein VNA25_01655 [Phycisphaerae bacterium]|nr:hypothetical protein [Phycisphaerae bacterium]
MASFWKWLLGWELGEVIAHGNWQLRFIAQYSNYINLVLMLVFVALLYLTVRSYRREGEAPRRAKAVIAGIRIAVIVLVFGILLQPAIVLRYVRSLTSSVVLLIDDSQSMGFKDRYEEPNVAELRDRLSKMLGVEAAELSGLTRGEIATRALAKPDGPVPKLAADHPLVVMRYSTTQPSAGSGGYTRRIGAVDMVQPEGYAELPTQAAGSLKDVLGALTRSGYSTNPPAGIRGALDLTQGQRAPVIVHVSDGQMTAQGGRRRSTGAIEYARERGVQVYSVLVGDPTPPKNVAVTALQAPREVRRGATVEFAVNITHRNMGNESVMVKLERRKTGEVEWVDTGVSQAVTLQRPSGDANQLSRSLQTVTLQLEPEELGEFEYRAFVEPRPGEENTADNSAVAQVGVADEKVRVLLISGDAGKEFQYLRNYLLRQKDDYLVSVWQQNADVEINQSASSGMKLDKLPRTLSELIGERGNPKKPGYNAVILYDPQHTQGGFDKYFVENLLKPFVEKHNGGLCFIASNKYTESVLLGDEEFKALQGMMAVQVAPDSMSDLSRIGDSTPQPAPVLLTAYGIDHPVTRLAGTPEQSVEIWDALPGIYWSHPVFRAKPGARVLAVSSNPMRRTIARNHALPLIVAQPYGKGSVLYLGFDETWRWVLVRDGYFYRRFWGNVVRYLATLQARRVTITTGGSRFTVGEPITIEVEAYGRDYQPLEKDKLEVDVVNNETGRAERTLELRAIEDKPGQFKVTFVAEHRGNYKLTPLVEPDDPNGTPAFKQIEIALPQAEFVRTEADGGTMKSMAWPPEKYLDVSQIDRLAAEIPAGRWTSTHEVPKYLWDTNLALVLIVVLLAAEWILRKRYNMA